MKRFITGIITASLVVFACFLGYTTCIRSANEKETLPTAASSVFIERNSKSVYKEKEHILLNFIKSRLMHEDGGVITNTSPKNRDSGTLSESVGILLDYAVINNNKELFDKEFAFLKSKLLVNDCYIKWKTGSNVTCNASIDDLRIAGALLKGYEVWREEDYLHTAESIQKSIYDTQVIDNKLYEIYDWNYKDSKSSTPLCYLDLHTIDKLKHFNRNWQEVFDNSLLVIEEGKIGSSPFYYKYFDYSNKKYSLDEEYKQNKSICLTYSIYTALHMAEAGIETKDFGTWLRSEMGKGKLYAWYNPYTRKPVSKMESTAVYALGSIYAKHTGDRILSEKLLDRMLEFMVTDQKSRYYGGFGNKDTGEFYSFDNLTALWALTLHK